jgi:hypothetical protein
LEQVFKTRIDLTGCVVLPDGAACLRAKKMEKPSEVEIVRRAYELWQQAGEPEGRDKEFYLQAEQELRNADKSSPLRTPDNL